MSVIQNKILVVDDEEDFCYFVKKNLEAKGEFRVLVATQGEDAVPLARLEEPDLILLDIMMPKLAGPDILEILKNDPKTKDIPVIFLTAIVTKAEIGVDPTRQIGGHKYMAKPVSVAELVDAIKEALKKKSSI